MTQQQILEKIRTGHIILGESSLLLSPKLNLIDSDELASLLSSLSERIEKLEGKEEKYCTKGNLHKGECNWQKLDNTSHDFATTGICKKCNVAVYNLPKECNPYIGAGGGKVVEECHFDKAAKLQDKMANSYASQTDKAFRCNPTPPEWEKEFNTLMALGGDVIDFEGDVRPTDRSVPAIKSFISNLLKEERSKNEKREAMVVRQVREKIREDLLEHIHVPSFRNYINGYFNNK